MIPYERHEAIMNLLREKKYVRTEQLSKALYVSVATIRRDLAEMEKNGFLQRVSGGARVIESQRTTGRIHGRRKCAKEKAYCQTGFPVI